MGYLPRLSGTHYVWEERGRMKETKTGGKGYLPFFLSLFAFSKQRQALK